MNRATLQLPADGTQASAMNAFSARRGAVTAPDQVIADTADQQHGVITLDQLRMAGLTPSAVRDRAAVGRLHRVHAGIYSVGHRPLDLDSRRMAAVLGCGPNAALSHRSAAALWGLVAQPSGAIDVTAPNRRGRSPAGINAHRHGSLRAPDLTIVRGIACTSVARTLLDLAGVVGVSQLRKAIAEAEVLRIFDLSATEALIARSNGRRGVARLRMLISELSPHTARTRSYLERKFLDMCEHRGIPTPEVNCTLNLESELLQPDFLWRDSGVVVETDGREAHGTASAFESDRRRDQVLSAAGWQVLRCTWRQVLHEPSRVAGTIRTILDRRA